MTSAERVHRDGTVESVQTQRLPDRSFVPTHEDARRLGSLYWSEVRRATRGLIRPRAATGGVDLCLVGRGPTLLRLGEPELVSAEGELSCTHRILGGALARTPGGVLRLEQVGGDASVCLAGFAPRLDPRVRYLRGPYALQARAHVAVSRRFLERLVEGVTR